MNETKRCLIIDDDQDDQEIFLMCLESIRYQIECATFDNGLAAINMLSVDESYTPDYIFLDVNMPRMNGIDCLRELRKIERLRETKILMYSTSSEGNVQHESRKLGANDFIVKPTKTSELKERLTRIFRPEARQQ